MHNKPAGNERLDNLKKRLEIEQLRGITTRDIIQSDGDSSPGLASSGEKDIVDRITKNFKKSEFSFSQETFGAADDIGEQRGSSMSPFQLPSSIHMSHSEDINVR